MTVPASDTIPRQTSLQRWLRIDQHAKPIVYARVYQTAYVFNINYWLEIVFSAGIAEGLHVPSANASICAHQRSQL